MHDKFIDGNVPLSKWEEYVEAIEKIGLDRYMEVQQDAFDRYKE